ncbi:hypothetical protein Nmel_013680 [Mimus melanotis]
MVLKLQLQNFLQCKFWWPGAGTRSKYDQT